MHDTIAAIGQARTNLGGRPVHPAITSLEGHVEAIVALGDDIKALRHFAHLQAQMNRLGERIASEMVERANRIDAVVLPECHDGYKAAEIVRVMVSA